MVNVTKPFDMLIAGGQVIDPQNGVEGLFDVAIDGDRILAVGNDIKPSLATEIFDASGMLVVPGLIDLHTHIYHKATAYGVDPDMVARRSLSATLVDAGSAGAGNFAGLRDFVIEKSPFRILAYLNISYPGIFAFDDNYVVGEATISELLSVSHCVDVVEANRDLIVGVKVRMGAATSGKVGMLALERAIEAAQILNLPVMSHIGRPPPTYGEILATLRPGDVLTHCFRPAPNAPVDDNGQVLEALFKARERGVLFDIGHGMGAFGFASAEAAIGHDFLPDIISSDVHSLCVSGPAYDLLHTMSKLINCGISMPDVVAMATMNPAQAMGRVDLGHLSAGAVADISLIGVRDSTFEFVDTQGKTKTGNCMLQAHGLFLGGKFLEAGARPWE